MLHDSIIPEKNVTASSIPELRDLLEEFRPQWQLIALDRICLQKDSTIEICGQELRCAQSFLEALAKWIEMPLGYAYRIDFDLFRENFERHKQNCSSAATLCLCRGVATNLAPAKYLPANTLDVLNGFDETWTFKTARLCERGVAIDLIRQDMVATPAVGDSVELGIRVTNSETGFRGLKAALYSHRLVCSNGAVMADSLGAVRWNYDPRVTPASSLAKFFRDLQMLRASQIEQRDLYVNVLNRQLTDIDYVNVLRRARLALNCDFEFLDKVLGVDSAERVKIQAAVRRRLPSEAPELTEVSLWDFHNRLTAAAQRVGFHARQRLEELGGGILGFDSPN